MSKLLPPNATALECAIEQTVHGSFEVLGTPQTNLFDPATCPAILLPWLAWALSVDTWDAAWPEAVQRRVIAASPAVHRAKGTRAAVAAALDGLFVRAGIIEWWQPGGSGVAGTFIVRAYASARWTEGAALVTPQLIAAITAMVEASAPVSRPFDLQVGIASETSIGAAAALPAALKISEPNWDAETASTCASVSLCASLASLSIHKMTLELAA